MSDNMVEVIEWISEGRVTRKTVNGIDVEPRFLDPLPTVVVQKLYMTREEVEAVYGRTFL